MEQFFPGYPVGASPGCPIAGDHEAGQGAGRQARLARLAFKCIHTEYANHIMHSMLSDKDLGTPSQLHPVFFGCYDWHSSVHGHLPSRWFRTTRAICRVFIIHSGGGVLANTAFGISFALDYARTMKDQEFERLLVERSRFYFLKDKQIA